LTHVNRTIHSPYGIDAYQAIPSAVDEQLFVHIGAEHPAFCIRLVGP
jgi:hypothetical protein